MLSNINVHQQVRTHQGACGLMFFAKTREQQSSETCVDVFYKPMLQQESMQLFFYSRP